MDGERAVRAVLRGSAVAVLVGASTALAGIPSAQAAVPFEIQNLDGAGNNVANPTWGQGNRPYARVTPARYADGRSQPVSGPNSRFVSNRIFNDSNQNVFSESHVSQWGFTWGQFLDHTFGLRQGRNPGDPQGETANIPFNASDPLEDFRNDLGVIPFVRSTPATGTGVNNQREQVNTVGSYIDAFAVYGPDSTRLEWLREGPVDGNLSNNSARLMLPNGYLPRRNARGNANTAPVMDIDGRLIANPANAGVAGDVRANENIALEATQTLFAREHNRIVGLLPASLSEEDKFQIARRIVIAEQQYITYNEFLPAMGISLPAYAGYNAGVNATLTNEFATVGYRAHSQVHGELEMESDVSRYSQATLDALEAQGVEVTVDGDEVEFAVPLNVAFFNPDLVNQVQLGPLLQGIGLESQYNNDEQIDNQLRSTLFQIPVSGNPECLDGPALPECFHGVVDLGAIDIERDRDHGIPSYNALRQAYNLQPRTSFAQITGESTQNFPADPQLTAGNEVNDPNSLDFTSIRNLFNTEVDRNDEAAMDADAVGITRRTPLAARLRAVYNNDVNSVDAFTGMVAEPHVAGTQFGELQRAIWTREFQRLRDGDRFFYGNQTAALDFIRNTYGIDFRRNLGDIIASNTDIPRAELSPNVFFVEGNIPPTACRVNYTVTTSWPGGFQVNMALTNTGTRPLNRWTLRFSFANGQQITELWSGTVAQSGGNVPVTNGAQNATIAAGQTRDGVGFNATWNNTTNTRPARFSLNTTVCSTG